MNDPAQNQQTLQTTGLDPQTQQVANLADGQATVLQQILGDDVATLAQGQLGSVQPEPPQLQKPISIPNRELGPIGQQEVVPLVELKEEENIPEEVQGWVEKLQKEQVSLPKPIKDGNEVVLAEPHVTFVDDKIVLPMTQSSFTKHAHTKVTESARWLVEWCKRLISMQGEEKTKFRE